jgi:uncharacterized membrane protein (UPF0127 family)
VIRSLTYWLVALTALVAAMSATAQEPMRFRASTLTVETAKGAHDFAVELALSPEQKARGLMFRSEMPADAGILFVYDRPQVITMWMRNTLIPLDMLFIGADGKIAHITERAVPRSDKTISSRARVVAVLELTGGAARRYGISVGDRVVSPDLTSAH